MPSFFDHLFGSDPPGPSTPRDGVCEECPYARDGNRRRGGVGTHPPPDGGVAHRVHQDRAAFHSDTLSLGEHRARNLER